MKSKFLFYTCLLAILSFGSSYQVNAQQQNRSGSLQAAVQGAENAFKKLPSEKLYLNFDKPYYSLGDTIWFKSYLLKAADGTASGLSTKLYVDLINDSSKLVTQAVVPLSAGLGQGYFALNENFYDGGYRIRAYTNWMQNFGEESFFTKQFYIGKPALQGGWLLNEQHNVKTTTAGKQVNMVLQLNDMQGRAVASRNVEIKLISGKKTVLKATQLTSNAGTISSDFTLPTNANTADLTLFVEDKTGKNSALNMPFYLNNQQQPTDLQFMPEGGAMVAGLYNKVGFKAISEDGKSVTVKGVIRDSKNEEIITFQSLHNGMGNFMLLPQAGEKYTAEFLTPDGVKQTTALPPVKPSGIAFRIDNVSDADSIKLYVTATPDIAEAKKPYTLVAQSKDTVLFGAPFNLDKGFNNFLLAKNMLRTGIVSFTVLDATGSPVSERRIFIDLHDQLKLSLAKNQTSYGPKDSVAVTLDVKDKYGKPVRGTFSVAVTDDGTIRNKNYGDNIESRFLLTSELKGNVEEPGWYVLAADADRQKALDNLLLTQGWTGYDWKGVSSAPPKFAAETDYRVSGKLTGFLKKPINDAKVSLFTSSKKYGIILIDTVSDKNGRFVFENLPLVDTIAYTIKAHNAKGKEIGAEITLDPFKPTLPTITEEQRRLPWYANANDSLMIKYFNRPGQTTLQGVNAADVKGKLLNEVVIKAKKEPVKMGKEFGYPKAEMTEKELINAGKTTLNDLIFQRFKSIHVGSYYSLDVFKRPARHSAPQYTSGTLLVNDVFVDGQSVQEIYGGNVTGDSTSFYSYLNMFFKYIAADDVKNVKLVEGEHAFMTITTRSGAGVFTRISPGSISFRPLPMLFPKQFYSPRYAVKNDEPDNRTTIFWEPNLVTGEDGKATLSFYTADKPSTYSIRVEGTDMQGHFGVIQQKIKVDKAINNTTRN